MFTYWLYISTAETSPGSAVDALICLAARQANRAHDITGYLHREDGFYIQYVEGPAHNVGDLRRLIRSDGRHSDVHDLDLGTVLSRRFSGWDMAFSTADLRSFRDFQSRRGGVATVATAGAGDILFFMETTACAGCAYPGQEAASKKRHAAAAMPGPIS